MRHAFRSTGLTCPVCDAALGESALPWTSWVCASCGGVWLPSETSFVVMMKHGGLDATTRAHVAELLDALAARASSARVPGRGPKACPQCTAPLFPLDAAHVALDFCPAHGTWFDAGEVAEYLRSGAFDASSVGFARLREIISAGLSALRRLVSSPVPCQVCLRTQGHELGCPHA
jgi:Zn-finger nucleic acid-binding protein